MTTATLFDRRRALIALTLLPLLALLVVFFVWPVGRLLLLSLVTPDGRFTGQHYQRLAGSVIYVQVLLITFKIAAWTTLCSLLIAYPVAFWLAMAERRTRERLTIVVLIAFWSSALIKTFAWLIILGRTGPVSRGLEWLGLIGEPTSMLFNLPAVVLGMTHTMAPLAILTMLSVMESIDSRLVPASSTLGARPGSSFWLIYFPLSLPGVTASAVLVFISAIGFFITPAFLGGRADMMIGQLIIEQVIELLNWPFAGAVSVLLLAVTLLGLVGFGRRTSLVGGAGKAEAANAAPQGEWRATLLRCLGRISDTVSARIPAMIGEGWILRSFCLLVLAFLLVPSLVMIPISFTASGFVEWPPSGFSLRWYEAFWNSPIWVAATLRSFGVAAATGIVCLLIAEPMAFFLSRVEFRGRKLLMGLILAPLIVPRVIIAVALFYLFAQLRLVGTSLGLIIGHVVLAAPYVVVTLLAALKGYDRRLDDAAATLGARPVETLSRIALPLLKTSFLSAFLFAFVTSFDELTVALFVTGGLMNTLPKQIWDEAFLQVTPILAAVSTLMLLFTTLVVLGGEVLRRSAAKIQSKAES